VPAKMIGRMLTSDEAAKLLRTHPVPEACKARATSSGADRFAACATRSRGARSIAPMLAFHEPT
jgi:hypothetical protein